MRINYNIASLNIQNSLGKISTQSDKTMKKLSTGSRINSAADDAAGMAISNKLKTQVNGLKMASRNSLDGISLVQTAEGALSEVQNMIQRMRQLSIQAANDTLQSEDRAAIQLEVDQLLKEIDDTAIKTEFNKIRLLNGDSDRATASSNSDAITSSFISDSLDPGRVTYDLRAAGTPAHISSTGANFPSPMPSESMAGKLNINGEIVEITATDSPTSIANKLKELCDRVGVEINITGTDNTEAPPRAKNWEDWLRGDATMLLTTQKAGSDQVISISSDNTNLLTALALPNNSQSPALGTDAQLDNVKYNGTTVLAAAKGNEISITANAGQTMRLNVHTHIDPTLAGGTLRLGDGTKVSLNPATQGELKEAVTIPTQINATVTIAAKIDAQNPPTQIPNLKFPLGVDLTITQGTKTVTIDGRMNQADALAQLDTDFAPDGKFTADASGNILYENNTGTNHTISFVTGSNNIQASAPGSATVKSVFTHTETSHEVLELTISVDGVGTLPMVPVKRTDSLATIKTALDAALNDPSKGEFEVERNASGELIVSYKNLSADSIGVQVNAVVSDYSVPAEIPSGLTFPVPAGTTVVVTTTAGGSSGQINIAGAANQADLVTLLNQGVTAPVSPATGMFEDRGADGIFFVNTTSPATTCRLEFQQYAASPAILANTPVASPPVDIPTTIIVPNINPIEITLTPSADILTLPAGTANTADAISALNAQLASLGLASAGAFAVSGGNLVYSPASLPDPATAITSIQIDEKASPTTTIVPNSIPLAGESTTLSAAPSSKIEVLAKGTFPSSSALTVDISPSGFMSAVTIPSGTAALTPAIIADLNAAVSAGSGSGTFSIGDDGELLFANASAGQTVTVNVETTGNAGIVASMISQPYTPAVTDAKPVLLGNAFPAESAMEVDINGQTVTIDPPMTASQAAAKLNTEFAPLTGQFQVNAATGDVEFSNEDLANPLSINVDYEFLDPSSISLDGLALDILDFGPLVLHVGPNQGSTLAVQLPNLNAEGLGLADINMRSRTGADAAIASLDEALNRVSDIRARLGAYQNRLEYTISNLDNTHENAVSSLSRIADTDMAVEMSEFTKLNVLSQAGISVLSQANMRPQQILSLLQ